MNKYAKKLKDMLNYYEINKSIEDINIMIDSNKEKNLMNYLFSQIQLKIKNEEEANQVINLLQNYLNNQERKILAGFTPEEKFIQTKEGIGYLEDLPDSFFTNIPIIHDFIYMLDYMKNNKTRKTKTGNICLKDLKKINEGLQLKKSPFKIRSEKESQYLHLLRILILLSGLIYKGENKIYFRVKLNKYSEFKKEKGIKKFLRIFSIYNSQYNWVYDMTSYAEEQNDFVYKLQNKRSIGYNLMLSMSKKDNDINLEKYIKKLLNLLNVQYFKDKYYLEYDIEKLLIENIRYFDLVNISYKTGKFNIQNINKFNLTKFGINIMKAAWYR